MYDADGEVTEVVDPMGRVTTTLYDADGEVTEVVDPMGRVTTTMYDADGEVTAVVDPLGNVTTTVYDADREVAETIDPLGRITTILYDADGEVTAVIDALGHATTVLYNADGEVTEVIDPLGHTTTTLYDADGEVTEVVDPMGRITTTLYDADGEVTAQIDPLGRTTTTFYDGDGEVAEVVDPMGRVTTALYDADGEVTEVIDPLGHATTTLYDMDGRVTEVVDPMGRVTTTMYDADGEVTAVIDPLGNTTTTLYDADGEVTATIDPLGHTTTTLYDADGEVTETIDALGRMTTSHYDGDRRLVSQTWYDAHDNVVNTESFTYDSTGNMLTAQDASGTYTMTYDSLNRVITTENPFGLTLTYTYDADGNRTQVQDSLGGVTNYVYDADNELLSEQFGGTGQTPLRVDLTYYADGTISTETRYSDLAGTHVVVMSSYSYNNDRQITSILDQDGSSNTVASFTYTYDQAGRVTSENNQGVITNYTYDADNELLSDGTSTYSYDAGGNRAGGGNLVGANNQLLTDGTWNYSYDADGNLIQKSGVATGPDAGLTWDYTYNNRNQLTGAVEFQGSTTVVSVNYTYDVFGHRIEEDVTSGSSTQVTRFSYDGQNVWADLDGSNNLVARRLFLSAIDSVTARITAGGTVAWYLTDHLGSVRVLTDNTGLVIDRINYDGYGNIINESNSTMSDRYLYTGAEFDRVTGLQYNEVRYYDPTTGRWTSEDPVRFAAGDTNLYRYIFNNPTNATDPSGEGVWGWVKAVGGGLEIAAGVGIGVAAGWTGIGLVPAAALIAHGADTTQAAVREIATGKEVRTITANLTTDAAAGLGADAGTAQVIGDVVDLAIPVVATAGGALVQRAPQGVQLAARVGAPLAQRGAALPQAANTASRILRTVESESVISNLAAGAAGQVRRIFQRSLVGVRLWYQELEVSSGIGSLLARGTRIHERVHEIVGRFLPNLAYLSTHYNLTRGLRGFLGTNFRFFEELAAYSVEGLATGRWTRPLQFLRFVYNGAVNSTIGTNVTQVIARSQILNWRLRQAALTALSAAFGVKGLAQLAFYDPPGNGAAPPAPAGAAATGSSSSPSAQCWQIESKLIDAGESGG